MWTKDDLDLLDLGHLDEDHDHRCRRCGGSGDDPFAPEPCDDCLGEGFVFLPAPVPLRDLFPFIFPGEDR